MILSMGIGLYTTIASVVVGAILSYIGYVELKDVKRINSISKTVPKFVSMVVETMKTGMVLSRAIIMISENNSFKYLSPLLKTAAERVKKGMSVSDALTIMAKELDNPLFSHVTSVISKVEESGGNVTGILEKMEAYAQGTVKATTKRAADMGAYTMVMFISFGVMVFTLLLAVATIFPRLAAMSGVGSGLSGIGGLSMGISASGINLVVWAFFAVGMIYSVANGSISGIFTGGSIKAGLLYVGLLMTLTAIAFFVASGGAV